MSINPLQFTANYQVSGLGKDQGKQPEAKKEEKAAANTGSTTVGADETLSIMAQQSASVVPAVDKTLDVSKYVNAEQAQRIGKFMGQFDDVVVEGLETLNNAPLSDDAKMTLSVMAADRIYTEKFRD